MALPSDAVFTGSIPSLYQTHLVPLLFEPYAQDLCRRLASLGPSRVLEVAAGTGVVTRAVARLPGVVVTATDLNPAMLQEAARHGTPPNVNWSPADALALPFPDGQFDAVVCQFGAMFFPDKAKAFAEARRVLRPGGAFLFNVWDHIRENEFADVVTGALAERFPDDPPRFLARTPHGYHAEEAIRRDVSRAGFEEPARFETVAARSRGPSPSMPALAYCQGTPLRGEIEARDPHGLNAATDAAAHALGKRFGRAAVDGKIQAHVVVVRA